MSSLKDKLYNLESTPPPAAWEKISAALDESHLADSFPNKLYNLEATPPANAWEKISAAISEAPTARVITMKKRAAGFIRYAAAAILLIVAGYFIMQWSGDNSDPGNNNMAVSTPDTSSEQTSQPDPSTAAPTGEITETNDVPVAPTEKLSNTNTLAKSSSIRKPATSSRRDPDDGETMLAYQQYVPDMAERYVMFMTPTGNIIRMSKKWGDMVCCVSGEEQDEDCKDQLKKWQEKLATSTATSTGGFMDVLSLVSALDNDL